MRALLDTSVLMSGVVPDFGDAELAISTISLGELHYAVLVATSEPVRAERLRRLGAIENLFDALPVDDAVAREYGRLAAAVARADRRSRARPGDLLIAATARAHDAQLWTYHGDDFVGVESLLTVRTLSS